MSPADDVQAHAPAPDPEAKSAGWGRRIWKLLLPVVITTVLLAAFANWYVLASTKALYHRRLQDVPAREVAVVPGAAVSGLVPSKQLEDRLLTAYELYRMRKVKRILVSGAKAPHQDEAAAMAHWLERKGVPRKDILRDDRGVRTIATMVRAARVFGVRQAVICTNQSHLPRALYLAWRAGIEAVGAVADQRAHPGPVDDHLVREAVARATIVIEALFMGSRQYH